MKTNCMFLVLLQFFTCCVITWKAESTLFAVAAYSLMVVILSGIVKHIVKKADG
jgi:hypothetical protein